MNIFRSIRTVEKKKLVKAEIIEEKDNGTNYPYSDDFCEFDENHSKKAVEMENILGNALAMTESSNGSIHSLQRSGTNSAIEIGRRIGSLHSRENLASEAHLSNNDSFSYISRTSSLGSAASLPTFVKAEKGDPMIFSQKSLENMMFDDTEEINDEENSSQNVGYDNTNHRKTSNSTNATKTEAPIPNRSWNKLRREVNEEARATTKRGKEENATFRRTQSFGRMAFRIPKKLLRESRNRLCSDNLEKCINSHSREKDIKDRKGYAKDYDVEVSLQTKKNGWDGHLSVMRGKGRKTASSTASKLESCDRNNTKTIGCFRKVKTNSTLEKTVQDVDDSFDNPKTNTEDSWRAPVENITVERKSDVVLKMHETHKGDLLFQALEVACCHSVDGGTLDLITDMIPPQV